MSFLKIGEKYTRPNLAKRWGYESHHAIAKGVVTPTGENVIILFVTRMKQNSFTQYKDYLSGDLLFWEGQEKHGTDDRVINAQQSNDELHLFYREVHHCPFEYMGLLTLVGANRRTDQPSEFVFRLVHDQSPEDDLTRFREDLEAIPDVTEREEIRKARVGQGRFRMLLLNLWRSRCAVTGVELPAVLMASHIKPWRSAANVERLNPFNGLLLLPQYDKLFDRGFISFNGDGSLVVSPAFPRDKFGLLGVSENARLTAMENEHGPFLAYHRDHVFIHTDPQD